MRLDQIGASTYRGINLMRNIPSCATAEIFLLYSCKISVRDKPKSIVR